MRSTEYIWSSILALGEWNFSFLRDSVHVLHQSGPSTQIVRQMMWGCLSNDSPTNHHFGFGRPAEGLKGKKKDKSGSNHFFFFLFGLPLLTLGANFFYYFLPPPIPPTIFS